MCDKSHSCAHEMFASNLLNEIQRRNCVRWNELIVASYLTSFFLFAQSSFCIPSRYTEKDQRRFGARVVQALSKSSDGIAANRQDQIDHQNEHRRRDRWR